MQQRRQAIRGGKAFLFLGVSLVTALLTALLIARLIERTQEQVSAMEEAQAATVDVVVATRHLYMGIPITEEDVAVRAVAPEMVPPENFFTSVDDALGHTPRERVLANEILRAERLARRDAGEGLNAIITPGMRAVSVAIKAEEAVAGFVSPGSYVDVIIVVRPDDKAIEARAVATTLLQTIRVLGVGDLLAGSTSPAEAREARVKGNHKGSVRGMRTVTLEVTPDQAREVALAADRGEILLTMRAISDVDTVETEWATTATLLDLPPPEAPKAITAVTSRPPPAPPPAPSGPTVVRGSTTENTVIGADGSVQPKTPRKR